MNALKAKRNWWFDGIVVVACIGGLAGAYWTYQSFPYGNFLYHYQGLITGILAGLAAFFTIRQMQITDARSEERHVELVELQTRRDALIVERLLVPNYRKLADGMQIFRQLECRPILNVDDGVDEEKAQVALEMERVATRIRDIFQQPSVKEAHELFDGRLKLEIESLKNRVNDLATFASVAGREPNIRRRFGDIRGREQIEGAMRVLRQERAEFWNKAVSVRADIIRLLEGLLTSMGRMALTYRLKNVVLVAG